MTVGLRPTAIPIARTYDFADPESDDSDICWYATNVLNLSSTLPSQQSLLQIDRGVDFYWVATSMQADVTSAGSNAQTENTIVLPLVNVQVQDAASGRYVENLSFPVGSLAGAGERCYNLVLPRVLRGATAVAFYWNAIVAAGTTYNNLYLVMHGFTRPSAWPS
jgi:hypothetical protein